MDNYIFQKLTKSCLLHFKPSVQMSWDKNVHKHAHLIPILLQLSITFTCDPPSPDS